MITVSNIVTLKKVIIGVDGQVRVVLELGGKQHELRIEDTMTVTNHFEIGDGITVKEQPSSPWGYKDSKASKLREVLKEFLA